MPSEMTMRERVARAICPERDGSGYIVGDDGRHYPGGVPRWHQWADEADAVLKAMREPSEAVLQAMHDHIRIMVKPDVREANIINDVETWQAMIDAALADSRDRDGGTGG